MEIVERTERSMMVPANLREDARSEGYLEAIRCVRNYDGSVPEIPWVIINVRWVIRNLIKKELSHSCAPLEDEPPYLFAVDGREARIQLAHVARVLGTFGLAGRVLLDSVWGFTPSEVSRRNQTNGKQTKSLLETARAGITDTPSD